MKKKNTIIFIPGFKGSVLVDQDDSRIWPNFWRAQFDHTTSLGNHLPDLNFFNSKRYKSKGVVESVDVIPGVFRLPVYGNFLRLLEKQLPEDTELIRFHYDWRQDLMVTIPRLKSLIDRIKSEKNGEIDIVCHSLGGIITSYILHLYSYPVIRHAFFVAVPFQGALKSVLDFMNGTSFGWNNRLLSPQALATFASLYYLLPRYEEASPGYSLWDIETWKQFKIGALMLENNKQREDFLARQLSRVNDFFSRLEAAGAICGAHKITTLYNCTNNTPYQIDLEHNRKITNSSGDGSVPKISLGLPAYFQGLPHDSYQIDKLHAKSFNSAKLLKIISGSN